MFPTIDLDGIANQINEEENELNKTTLGRIFMINFIENKATIIMENGRPKECKTIEEKVKVYVQVLLRTAYEKFKIYKDTEFGMTYFNYRGQRNLPQGFMESEIKREIEKSLLKLNVVERVQSFSAKLTSVEFECNFEIILKDGQTVRIKGG
ncbi:MAG: DUF2634 domain-containing protein [Psychrilyobacter sp.]|uniref:DUF2634 domain-containing protein n=1 Tax=Psychrilyobacter sp. TaxID=2586924 RepID=UPI003C77D470